MDEATVLLRVLTSTIDTDNYSYSICSAAGQTHKWFTTQNIQVVTDKLEILAMIQMKLYSYLQKVV